MRIAFISCPRTPEYLSGTLKSLKDAGCGMPSVGVFFDGLWEQADPNGVGLAYEWRCRTAAELGRRKGWGNPALATVNYMRALDWLEEFDAHEPKVACEDDLEFAHDFEARVRDLSHQASARSAKWVIALHHLYRREEFPVVARSAAGDALLGWSDPNSFYGSQAMAFAPGVAADLAAMWRALGYRLPDGRPEPGTHMDMGIKRYCLTTGTPLYTVDPCLIQHVGDVSVTIAGREPIRNRYFKG